MVDVFLRAWNPLVEFEQLSLHSLAQGLLYWEALAPMGDRWKDIDVSEVAQWVPLAAMNLLSSAF